MSNIFIFPVKIKYYFFKKRYEVRAGEKLTYICKEGKILEEGKGEGKYEENMDKDDEATEKKGKGGRRTLSIPCLQDGTYKIPKEWPKCY